jgi:hypothetical protein
VNSSEILQECWKTLPKANLERSWKIVKENVQRILEIPPVSSSDHKITTSTDELEYQP